MACFTAPLAQAVVVAAAKSACKDRIARSSNPFLRRLVLSAGRAPFAVLHFREVRALRT